MPGVEIEEHHMADGSGTVSCGWSPSTYDEFVTIGPDGKPTVRYVHLEHYDPAGVLTDIMVLQDVEADADKGITLTTTGLSWWLGSGAIGPLILRRDFISGANKLSDGDFELDFTGNIFVNWKISEGSHWLALEGAGLRGGVGAYVVTDPAGDDPLVSDEPFDVVPGQQLRNSMWIYGGTGHGRVRCRVIFDGKFNPPNLVAGGNFESAVNWIETSLVPGDAQVVLGDPVFAHSGSGHLRMTTTQWAPVTNGGAETGTLAGWVPVGTWPVSPTTPFTGSWCFSSAGGGPTKKFLYADSNPASPGTADVFPVSPGEEWRIQGAIRGGFGGGVPDGRARLICRLYAAATGDAVTLPTDAGTIIAGDVGGGDVPNWTIVQKDFTIPDGVHGICPAAMLEGHTSDSWYFDGIEIVRLRGNQSSMLHNPTWSVTPQRGYLVQAFIRSDGESMNGQVRPRFTFFDTAGAPVMSGSTPMTVEGGPQGVSQDWLRYQAIVSPPSGGTFMTITWICEDTTGGAIHIDDVTCVDNDATTLVYDAISPSVAFMWTQILQDITVPGGATKAHAEVVAEANSIGWLVDDVVLSRIGVPFATHADVVNSLLLDPDTGLPMTVYAGTVTGPGLISYDWTVLRRIVRDALEHFCRVIAAPPLEWWINPATRQINVGIPISVFTDHSPTFTDPIVFQPQDIEVTDLPAGKISSAQLVDKVLVIGADKVSTSGVTITTTGSAVNVTGQVDWNGHSPNRTALVVDSTVDQKGYAAALAADEAGRNANPTRDVTVTLSGSRDEPGHRERGARPGDWVYAYKPSAGLEGTNPGYETTINGRDVIPARMRIPNRRRTFAGTGSSRIDVRRLDGTVFTLADVNWSDDDSTVLELTDIIPAFASDPQGGSVARQFLNWRASSPR